MASCTCCLNTSGEFGSTRVVVVEVDSCERPGKDDGKFNDEIGRESAVVEDDWDACGVLAKD